MTNDSTRFVLSRLPRRMALISILFAASCAPTADSDAAGAQHTLRGTLKFVFLERQMVVLYFMGESKAFALRVTPETAYVDVGSLNEGDGLGHLDGRRLHSSSTYEIRASVAQAQPAELKLLNHDTLMMDVEEIKLLSEGHGPCIAYLGILVPQRPGSGGFAPVLPESVQGKTGVFVQNGTTHCTIVPAGPSAQLTTSFSSNGSIDINTQIPWAR